MKEYIAEYIVPVEKKGKNCMFDFMNAKPLIRCKDCKHHLECDYWIENGDDWYCADGERKEGM